MRSILTKHGYAILAALVVAAAFALRAHGARWGLPMVLEEATPMKEATGIWMTVAQGQPDLNPHFFNYPSLTIYIQTILQGIAYAWQRLFGTGFDLEAFFLTQRVDPTLNVLLGRLTGIAASAGSTALLFLMVRRLAGPAAGVLAAALLALAPLDIVESRFIQTDPVLAFLTTLAVLLAMRLAERGRLCDYLCFGGAVGLAAAAKYPGLFALVCLASAHYYVARREGRGMRAFFFDRRILAALGAAVVLFFVASPFCLLDARSFWSDFSFERDHMKAGHFGQVGGTGISLPHYIRDVLAGDFGVPVTALFILGMIAGLCPGFTWRRRGAASTQGPGRRAAAGPREAPAPREAGASHGASSAVRDARAGTFIFSLFPLVFLTIVGAWTMRADRYLLPLMPFVAGLPVLAIVRLASMLGRRRAATVAVTAALFAAAAAQPAIRGIASAAVTADSRELARAWILENAPANDLLVKEELTPDFWREADYAVVMQRFDAAGGRTRERGLATLSETPFYQVVEIPLFVLYPEGSAPFYDIRAFAGADFIITSSLVKSRYTADPAKYRQQNAFYGYLDEYWERAASFGPGGRVAGPEIAIYRHTERTDSLVAASLGPLEEAWFAEWKVNPAELFRFSKPLAKMALARGDYGLADVLFKACNPADPEVRYGLAAMAGARGRYEDMIRNVEWLLGNYLAAAARAAAASRGTGPTPLPASANELRARIVEILDRALIEPGLSGDQRSKVWDLRDKALALGAEAP